MASNNNVGMGSSNTGLRHRKSFKDNDAANYNPQNQPQPQMMGWMPMPNYQQQQVGIGGWMPHPGMQQPYPHPQMMGWMPPYPNPQMIGWMPVPNMQQQQQPMMMLPPPAAAFNNTGFKPLHNGNIQDIMQINELADDDESEDSAPIPPKTKAAATAAAAAGETDDEDVVHVPNPKNTNKQKAKEPKQKVPALAKQEQHQGNMQDNQLANLFDNVLDNNLQPLNLQQSRNAEFGQEADESNIICGLTPIDRNQAHFDSANYPNEQYKTVMINGDSKTLPAKDISPDALETGKVVYEHNTKLVANGNAPVGKAFIYARSSRTNDISIETQRKACIQYAGDNNLELLSFGFQSDNNISARNMGNLNHELGFWKDEIPNDSHIIIYSVDRLSRHLIKGMQFLDEMATRGIRVHFTTHEIVFHSGSSAAIRAMVQQELQSAEKFSNIASEKVRTTMARLRREGHVFGRAPYGYKHALIGNIRKRIPDNREQQNIRKIQSQYEYIMGNWDNNPETAGTRYSKASMIRVLGRWCNRSGLKYRNQKNYTTSQVRKIVEMEVNNN